MCKNLPPLQYYVPSNISLGCLNVVYLRCLSTLIPAASSEDVAVNIIYST